MSASQEPSFLEHMIPKSPTQSDIFLTENPNFDGRQVRVAVLDTGVDPGAAGLSVSTTGSAKIIDIRDCTGDADVALLKMVISTSSGEQSGEKEEDFIFINGLREDRLKISKSVSDENPTKKWFLGEKNIFAVFPKPVRKRLAAKHEERAKKYHELIKKEVEKKLAVQPEDEKLKKQLELLKTEPRFDSEGFVVTVVLYQDINGVFKVLLDKQGDGDLTQFKPISSFKISQQFDKWDEVSQLNYCVNVETEDPAALLSGNLSSSKVTLICDNSSHGTHVASILAGNHPENRDLNGIAPGAEVVSLRIGDGRLGTMETNKSIVKAVSLAVELGCDLVNMSFGEASTGTSEGIVVETIQEAVRKHGLIFVTSAGNSGPSLSTVGAPGSSPGVISVGAYVDRNMKVAQYGSIVDGEAESLYDWTSRGPTYDGSLGVSICSPGGAVASVPQWVLHQKDQKNGTSMASPNACGSVALLLSALKQKKIRYSPVSVQRAIENSARKIDGMENFGMGKGLIQIKSAFEMLMSEKEYVSKDDDMFFLDLPFDFVVSSAQNIPSPGTHLNRGIYLRDPAQVKTTSTHNLFLKPIFNHTEEYSEFSNSKGYTTDKLSNPSNFKRGEFVITRWPISYKNKLQMKLMVECSEKWVKTTEEVLYHGSESINILIDPRNLPAGVHFTWVNIYEARTKSLGPLFKLPVTIVVPENSIQEIDFDKSNMKFYGGLVKRTFLAIPKGASFLDLSIKLLSDTKEEEGEKVVEFGNTAQKKLFYICGFQMSSKGSYRNDMAVKYGWFDNTQSSREPLNYGFEVSYPGIIEITFCQSWRYSQEEISFDLSAKFQGIVPSTQELVLSPSPKLLLLNNYLRMCTLTPTATYKAVERKVFPRNVDAEPQLVWDNDVLSYEYLSQMSPGDKSQEETSRSPAVGRLQSIYRTLTRINKKDTSSEGISELRRQPYRVVLEYDIDIPEPLAIKLSHPVHNFLYESPVFCQMILVYNQDKKLMFSSDTYSSYNKVDAGKYLARFCLFSENPSTLSALRSQPLTLSFKVDLRADVAFYGGKLDFIKDKKMRKSFKLSKDESVSLCIVENNNKSPKWAKVGDVMVGEMYYFAEPNKGKGYKIMYHVGQDDSKKKHTKKIFDAASKELFPEEKKKVDLNILKEVSVLKKKLDQVELEEVNKLIKKVEEEEKKKEKDFALKDILIRLQGFKLAHVCQKYTKSKKKEDGFLVIKICEEVEKYLSKEVSENQNKQDKDISKYTDNLTKSLVSIYCVKGYVSLKLHPKDEKTLNSAEKDLEKIKTLNVKKGVLKTQVDQLLLEVKFVKEEFEESLELIQTLKNKKTTKNLLIPVDEVQLYKKEISCLKNLHFYHLAENLLRQRKLSFPLDYDLF
eukprot:maker-scaffold_46-snap-gene-0.47-mRNA-1 protein AED:0.02 eAED:0.13 QI:33/1/0.5/1/1/1/2/0/1376